MNDNKKNIGVIIALVAIVVAIALIVIISIVGGKSKETNNNDNSELKLLEVKINGVKISFPADKNAFEKTGWNWDSDGKKEIEAENSPAYGGKIGNSTAYAKVTVRNDDLNNPKKAEDCIIDTAMFCKLDNSKDEIVFFGGITFDSTEEEVKNTMQEKGYKNVKVLNNFGVDASYTYYLDDDNKSNTFNYIKFEFNDSKLVFVSISAQE